MTSYRDTSWEPLQNLPHLNESRLEKLENRDWIVGFSGGADSVLSLHYLVEYHKRVYQQKKTDRGLILYYLNHSENFGLQKEAQRKKVFNTWTTRLENIPGLNVSFIKKKRNVKQIANKLKYSFEYTGSLLRKKHLKILAAQTPHCAIVLGHNLNDWYETVIMRINRGASPESIYPFDFWETEQGVNIFRPLCFSSREFIRSTCLALGLAYWDDPGNYHETNLRAKVRGRSGPLNPKGLQKSMLEFLTVKRNARREVRTLSNLLEPVKPGREYRVSFSLIHSLSIDKQIVLLKEGLKLAGFGPMSAGVRARLARLPFQYKNYSVVWENWHGEVFCVIRRGRKNLRLNGYHEKWKNFKQINGSEITGKHYIQLAYGRKSVKKIFSEKRLSQRQKENIVLYAWKENPRKVVFIPLSIYGMKDMLSVNL